VNIFCRLGLHGADTYAVTYAGAGETKVQKACYRCGWKIGAWVEQWEAGQ
jgi:hypothetical protein